MNRVIRLLPVFAVIAAALQAQTAPSRTVWDGVFTAAQANRGQNVYSAACASCHRDDMSGPFEEVLKGERFMNNWREQSVFTLFALMESTMPQLSPGSLKPAAYIDIVAYVLQVNGFPAGSMELNLGTLRNVVITSKDAPGQVPDGSLVSVVGCLTQSLGGWEVISAGAAQRTMNPDKPLPGELKAALGRPEGSAAYLLEDPDFFRPASRKGQRVLAKGFLLTASGAQRLNLTALETVATACSVKGE